MRLFPIVVALAALGVAMPASADKRLDKAVAKAERQLTEGKEDDAVETLTKAVSKVRRDPEAPLVLARFLSRLGRLDDAGAALEEAAERSTGGPPAVRARVLAVQPDHDSAHRDVSVGGSLSCLRKGNTHGFFPHLVRID